MLSLERLHSQHHLLMCLLEDHLCLLSSSLCSLQRTHAAALLHAVRHGRFSCCRRLPESPRRWAR